MTNKHLWLIWIGNIAEKTNKEDVLDHISKHIKEFERKRGNGKLDNWLDSMINLIAIYRELDMETFFNFPNLITRMELHRDKLNSIKYD